MTVKTKYTGHASCSGWKHLSIFFCMYEVAGGSVQFCPDMWCVLLFIVVFHVFKGSKTVKNGQKGQKGSNKRVKFNKFKEVEQVRQDVSVRNCSKFLSKLRKHDFLTKKCWFGVKRSFPEKKLFFSFLRLSNPNLSPKISQNGQTVLEIFKFEFREYI